MICWLVILRFWWVLGIQLSCWISCIEELGFFLDLVIRHYEFMIHLVFFIIDEPWNLPPREFWVHAVRNHLYGNKENRTLKDLGNNFLVTKLSTSLIWMPFPCGIHSIAHVLFSVFLSTECPMLDFFAFSGFLLARATKPFVRSFLHSVNGQKMWILLWRSPCNHGRCSSLME